MRRVIQLIYEINKIRKHQFLSKTLKKKTRAHVLNFESPNEKSEPKFRLVSFGFTLADFCERTEETSQLFTSATFRLQGRKGKGPVKAASVAVRR